MTLRLAFTAVLLLAVLTSCNTGASGIFAGIESETKIVANGDMPVKATITSMAEDSSRQYAVGRGNSGGTFYFRKVESPLGKWASDSTLTDSPLAVAGQGDGKVYRVLQLKDGSGSRVEWYDPSAQTWSTVTLAAKDVPLDLVPVIGNDGHTVESVVVVTQNSDTKSYQDVYLLTGSASATGPVDLAPASTLGTPVTSAAVRGSGYLLLNRSYLWSTGAGLSSPTVVTTAGVTEYAAVLNLQGTASLDGVYLATKRVGTKGGSLVVGTLSGSTFTTTTTLASEAKDGTSSTGPLDFTTLVVAPASSTHLLVGTATYGFGEATATTWVNTPTSATVDTNNYSVSDLPTSYVTMFFVSPTGTLYLGTNSRGLWSQKADKTWSN